MAGVYPLQLNSKRGHLTLILGGLSLPLWAKSQFSIIGVPPPKGGIYWKTCLGSMDPIDKALHNIVQSYWCDFEDGFSYMDIDEAKMRNSIYGNTPEEIVLNVIDKTKAKLRSFLMSSY